MSAYRLSMKSSSSAPNPSEIGIDMGVKRFVTMSNGDFVEPLNPFKQEQEKLAKLQRKLARQKKGSRNSRKTKRKIARLHRYIADSRRDFLHKTSTKIAKNHSIVYVEDLEGLEHVRFCQRNKRIAGQKRQTEEWTESINFGSGMVWLFPDALLQIRAERRKADKSRSQKHEPNLSSMRACLCREQKIASDLCMHWLRFPLQRR